MIKALAVAEPSDFDTIAAYEANADMLLFDARPPKGAQRGGGHGAAFDWKILSGRAFSKPWFLAGGLTPTMLRAPSRCRARGWSMCRRAWKARRA